MRKYEKIIQFNLWNIKCGSEIGSPYSTERLLLCSFGYSNKLIDFITSKLLGSNMEIGLIREPQDFRH
jgi:hypothetical protein